MKKISLLATAIVYSSVSLTAQDDRFMQPFRAGGYEAYILVEGSGTGSADILIDAPEDALAVYAPDGAFPIATNAVLLKGRGHVTLIDTGYGRNIFNEMAAVGVSGCEVDRVLLTHMHGDHIGGMFRDGEKAFPNARVVVSRREYEYWSSSDAMNELPEQKRGAFTAAQKVFAEYADGLQIVDPYELGGGSGRRRHSPHCGIRPHTGPCYVPGSGPR